MQVVSGNGADTWFPDGFIPDIFELVLTAWEKLKLRRDVRLEPRITNLLCDALEDEYVREDKDWFIFPEIKHSDPVTGKEVSRTDISIYHRAIPGQKLYFVFEAKRLHVESGRRIRGGYAEYVGSDGMMCFITGKYSVSAPSCGMLGYVMDGDIKRAAEGLAATIVKQSALLQLKGGGHYQPSPFMSKHPLNGETQHLRKKCSFTIYHLLLPFGKATLK